MRIVHRTVASSIICGAFAAGCLGGTVTDDSPAEPSTSETAQGLASSFLITTYFAEAAHINEVGGCISASICTGGSRVCTGTKTAFFTSESESCFNP
jgi:hypothetical protein